jgi:hypothetical protein
MLKSVLMNPGLFVRLSRTSAGECRCPAKWYAMRANSWRTRHHNLVFRQF